MSKKQEFIKYVNELINATKADPVPMNEEAQLYWTAFCGLDENGEKPLFTDKSNSHRGCIIRARFGSQGFW